MASVDLIQIQQFPFFEAEHVFANQIQSTVAPAIGLDIPDEDALSIGSTAMPGHVDCRSPFSVRASVSANVDECTPYKEGTDYGHHQF